MATTRDIPLKTRVGDQEEFEVAASVQLFGGAFACLDSNGRLVDATDHASRLFAGIVVAGRDNSSGAAGDKDAMVYTSGEYLLTGSGFSAADEGKPVYLIDNDTVGLAGNADVNELLYVGIITRYKSATTVYVDIHPLKRRKKHQFRVQVSGENAAELDLSTAAAKLGGTDIHVYSVMSMVAYVTADGSLAGLRDSDDYSVASGALSVTGDESANTLLITLQGDLIY